MTRQPVFGALAPTLLLTAALAAVGPPSASAADEQPVRRREVVVVGGEEGHEPTFIHAFASRGYLGVGLVDLTPELRRHFGAPQDAGVLVSRVEEDSPAALAGIEVGDVIAAFDGRPVRSAAQLARRVGEKDEGDGAELEVWRDGGRLLLTATLVESDRPQLDVGRFIWRGHDEGEGPPLLHVDPDSVDRIIAVDPESINESVRELIERLEESELPQRMRLRMSQREELEQRIEELERRLEQMERLLRERSEDGP